MGTLGRRSTALEALQGADLHGKKAIVTGATSGIGVETARALAQAGASVVLAVRSTEAGEKLKAEFEASLPSGHGDLSVAKLDLADLRSVRAFSGGDGPLDILINNAGVMGPPLGITPQGFESQLGTNHLGHFLLTQQLLPRLQLARRARVVNVSSELHRRGRGSSVVASLDTDRKFEVRTYDPQGQYGDSKLANILFTRALAKRLPANVSVYALHPGVIATNLTRSMPGAAQAVWKFLGPVFGKSVPQGAATSVWAAVSPTLDGKSGEYLVDCAVAQSTAESRDDGLAEKVFDLSVKAVQA
jgi:NAD(P)-dependent dehydrogenase (short-subunit alcohol dehydrogenase family)